MKNIYIVFFLTGLTGLFSSCAEDNPDVPDNIIGAKAATVETLSTSNVTSNTVTVNGEIIAENGSTIINKGFVYYPKGETEKRDSISIDLKDSFSGNITDLESGTDYIVQAYVESSAKKTSDFISYGKKLEFKTIPEVFKTITNFNTSVSERETAGYMTLGKRGFEKGYLLGGEASNGLTNEFWEFDGKEWKAKTPDIPVYRSKMTAFTTDISLIFYGGLDENKKPSSDLYAYYNSEWSLIEPKGGEKPEPFTKGVGCYLQELFFIGGLKYDNVITKEVWGFKPDPTNTWERKPDFKVEQFGGIAIPMEIWEVNKEKYTAIFAGLGRISNWVESSHNRLWATYDKAQTWQEKQPKPGGTTMAGVFVEKRNAMNNRTEDASIYVIDNENYIWRYDVLKDKWSQKSQLPQKNRKEIYCMYSINNLIYIGVGNGVEKELICYNPDAEMNNEE